MYTDYMSAPKKYPGRPVASTRIDPALYKLASDYAAEQGITRAELFRRIISTALEQLGAGDAVQIGGTGRRP